MKKPEPLTSGFASGGLIASIQNFSNFESWCFGSKFMVKIRPNAKPQNRYVQAKNNARPKRESVVLKNLKSSIIFWMEFIGYDF